MKKIYTIGRDESCDIVIPDNTDIISRLHATIRVESYNKLFITDQSRNGTYINGMKMSSNVEIPVTRKDVISFAHIYNLDWSLVPKSSNNKYKILISIFILMIISAAILWMTLGTKNNSGNSTATLPMDSTIVIKNQDSTFTVKEDTIESEPITPVATQKPVIKKRKDSIKIEQPSKPIDNNPIY